MRKEAMHSTDFWNRFIAMTLVFYIVWFLFIFLPLNLIYGDRSNLYEFQHDLFAAVRGENTKYERMDAQNIADVLKKIPKEEFDENFGYIIAMSVVKDRDNRVEARDALMIEHPKKIEQIAFYHDIVEDGSGDGGNDFRDTVRNAKTRMALKEALVNGGPAPALIAPKPIFFSSYSIGWNIVILIVIFQFLAFGVYCLICVSKRDHPLNLPEGFGSKIAMMAIFPGNLPLIVLLLIIRLFSRFHFHHELLSSRDKPGAAAARSRQTLENVKRRIGA